MGTIEGPTEISSRHLSTRMSTLRPSPIRALLRLVDQPGVLSMAGGLPALSALDADRVRAVIESVLDHGGALGPTALQYGPTEGVDPLRRRLAGMLSAELPTDADDILVTTGSQQGLDLLARASIDPGDVVVVEAPSYLGALQSFSVAGARIVAIDGDHDGIDVDRLAAELAGGLRPKVLYVVANFHNPTGAVLSLDRRIRLVELAEHHGFFIISDDPYGELRFAGPPLPSIAALGVGRPVSIVRLGSASKILAPGLRVGWMTGPPALLEAAGRLKQSADLHTSTLSQLVVAELLADEGAQRAHLDRIRSRYRERAGALSDALGADLGERVDFSPPTGGMFTWVTALDGTDTVELFPRAIDHGVAFVPGAAFSVDGGGFTGSLRLSFATLDPTRIRIGVARLIEAWRP
jgi:2-aminoadipate transaminase